MYTYGRPNGRDTSLGILPAIPGGIVGGVALVQKGIPVVSELLGKSGMCPPTIPGFARSRCRGDTHFFVVPGVRSGAGPEWNVSSGDLWQWSQGANKVLKVNVGWLPRGDARIPRQVWNTLESILRYGDSPPVAAAPSPAGPQQAGMLPVTAKPDMLPLLLLAGGLALVLIPGKRRR